MSRWIALSLALLLVASVGAAADTGAPTTENVTAEDGATYEIPTTLEFDVNEDDQQYSVRTADSRLFVNSLHAGDGVVILDTESMEPGDYVLMNQDTEEVVYEFTLVYGETPPPTETSTTRPSTDEPQSVAPVPEPLRVSSNDRPDATAATTNGVHWTGQDLAFRVDGDTEYILRSDGETLGRLFGTDHFRYLNTTTLGAGMYTIERPDDHIVYRFTLSEQTLSGTADTEQFTVSSNRHGYDLALTAPNVTSEQLLTAIPATTARDGEVVLTDAGAEAEFEFDPTALPAGNHSLTLTVLDTGVSTNVTLVAPVIENASTPADQVGNPAPLTATSTPTVTPTPDGTSTATGTQTPTAELSTTAADAPGFGALIALVAVFAFVVHRRRW